MQTKPISISRIIRERPAGLGIALLLIFHIVGIVGFNIPVLRPYFQQLSFFHLLLSAVIVLSWHTPWKPRFAIGLFVLYLLSFASEWIGVRTGFPFGEYRYGNALGPRLDGIPLVIGMNWVLLLYASSIWSRLISKKLWVRSVLTAFLMVLADLPIEPIAPTLDFWYWAEGSAPLQNYAGWFGISFLLAFWLNSQEVNRNLVALAYLPIVWIFFLLLNLV
jgi:putative membrane protein